MISGRLKVKEEITASFRRSATGCSRVGHAPGKLFQSKTSAIFQKCFSFVVTIWPPSRWA
jgi:hypothetical protein